jgi:hypothetical protein
VCGEAGVDRFIVISKRSGRQHIQLALLGRYGVSAGH